MAESLLKDGHMEEENCAAVKTYLGQDNNNTLLEEVVVGVKLFGYFGAVKKEDADVEGKMYDAAFVAFRTEYKVKAGAGMFSCCQSQART